MRSHYIYIYKTVFHEANAIKTLKKCKNDNGISKP